MKGSSMEPEYVDIEPPTDAVAVQTVDPIAVMSDRELAEFTARNTKGILDGINYIKEAVEPAMEKLGPVLSMMGLG